MSITYDPNKNQINIQKHGLDFEQVYDFDWDSAWIYQDNCYDYDEICYIAYGMLEKRLHFVCFAETDVGIRVISFRKANKREVKSYEQKTLN